MRKTATETDAQEIPRIGPDVVTSIARDAKRENFELKITSPSTGDAVHFCCSTATLTRILSDLGDQLERLDRMRLANRG